MSRSIVAARICGSIFSVGIDYTGSRHPPLPHAVPDAQRVERLFAGWGFVPSQECGSLSTASTRDIIDGLERWVDSGRSGKLGDGVVFYLAAHGRLHNGRHYMLAATSPEKPPYFASKAISAEDVVQAVLNSGATAGLVMLDACYSAFAAHEIQQALDRAAVAHGVPGMDLAVLVPSLHHEKSYSGLFVDGMLEALENGSRGGYWKDGDEFVTLFELRDELRLLLQDEQCAHVAGRDGLKIIPNPRYRADAADRAVELGELLKHLPPADREHFLRKAAGSDAGDVGWFFSGRRRMTEEVVRWLRANDQGVLVVTGVPGSGKSAFLGRLAVLADIGSQAACRVLGLLDDPADTRPPVGVFDAVVHIRNRRADDVARDVAEQLGIDLSASSSPPRDLVNALIDAQAHVTVLADALDEAEQGDEALIARDILRAVGNLAGCRVVVGTRRDRDGGHVPAPEDPGPLIATLRPRNAPFTILDLSTDDEADADIRNYVEERLAQPESCARWSTAELRGDAARRVAGQARRVFLYARFAIRALATMDESVLREPEWWSRLPTAVGEAGLHDVFAQDLLRFEDPNLVREVLTPLAFARGKGLPRRQIWPELASALAAEVSGRSYNAADVSRVIREAAWYLIEGTEDGQAVFRLYHQSIGDYLRNEVARGRSVAS
jgi:hypothetical protein